MTHRGVGAGGRHGREKPLLAGTLTVDRLWVSPVRSGEGADEGAS